MPTSPSPVSDLVRAQEAFWRDIGLLIVFVYRHDGWTLQQAEGYVGDSIDKSFEDTPHLRHGCHFYRLAQDMLLRVNGTLVKGDHPGYKEMGDFWKSLNTNNAWGGDFPKLDADHFSRRWGGMA